MENANLFLEGAPENSKRIVCLRLPHLTRPRQVLKLRTARRYGLTGTSIQVWSLARRPCSRSYNLHRGAAPSVPQNGEDAEQLRGALHAARRDEARLPRRV